MKRWQIHASIVLIILTLLMLIPTSLFAWLAFVDRKPLAYFQIGDVFFTPTINNQVFLENLDLVDLAYVDFENDVVLNRDGVLNEMATSVKVMIGIDIGSFSVQTTITLIEPPTQEGLLYLLIFEGVNVPSDHVFATDYHSYLAMIFDDPLIVTPEEQRAAILAYNEEQIQIMKQFVLAQTETIAFQIVFWGDYNDMTITSNYLTKTFYMDLLVEATQYSGGG